MGLDLGLLFTVQGLGRLSVRLSLGLGVSFRVRGYGRVTVRFRLGFVLGLWVGVIYG